MEFPTELIVDETTRAGRMMLAGDIRITLTRPFDDGVITIRFKALLDNRFNSAKGSRPKPESDRNWVRVTLHEATHVFVEIPNLKGEYPEKVGTFYPRTGKFFADKSATNETVMSAIMAANWMTGNTSDLTDPVSFTEEPNCGVCGRTLTDPDSITRGIGPECYQQQQKARQLRFPSKSPESSPFMVSKIMTEIASLAEADQAEIYKELKEKLA